jgi:hypothetical protein
MALVRSLLVDDAQIAFRSKSNFYSLFGACLRYYRASKRTGFKSPEAVAKSLESMLTAVRLNDLGDKPLEYAEYADAVTRAASDKGRRQRREDILHTLIAAGEA